QKTGAASIAASYPRARYEQKGSSPNSLSWLKTNSPRTGATPPDSGPPAAACLQLRGVEACFKRLGGGLRGDLRAPSNRSRARERPPLRRPGRGFLLEARRGRASVVGQRRAPVSLPPGRLGPSARASARARQEL